MISMVKLVADPYPPYQFEQDGKVTGMDHDIISEAFKVHGVDVQTTLHDWDECVTLLDAGKADGIFQITRNPRREEIYIFSALLRTARTLFFKKGDTIIQLNERKNLADQLSGTKIGVLAGYSYNEAVDRLKSSLKVKKTASKELLQGLFRDEFALALIDEGVAAFLMKRLGVEGVEQAPGFEISRPLYVAFRKNLPEPVHLFNLGLAEIRKNGVYKSVCRHYG
jgi:polar amino acid transport system substrate-binding protein